LLRVLKTLCLGFIVRISLKQNNHFIGYYFFALQAE